MNIQQFSSPRQKQQKISLLRLFLVIASSLLIIFGLVILWYNAYFREDALPALIFVTIPCAIVGLLLIMFNIPLRPSFPPRRHWPGAIACFFTALTVIPHTLALLPLSFAFPPFIRAILLFLYFAGPLFAISTAAAALALTEKMKWAQGRLLAQLAFWLSLFMLLHICCQARPYGLFQASSSPPLVLY